MNDTPLIKTYRGTSRLLGPLLPFWVKRRSQNGKEDPERLPERQGIASTERPAGPLVWMHGASVGECTMLLPLIAKLWQERPDINILITSGTVTSAKIMGQRLPGGIIHQYVPLDHPKYVKRFFAHWKPDLALWSESEIWPNLIREASGRGTKMALINARMSAKSIEGWAKRRKSAQAIFSLFDLILAADESTSNSLTWLLDKEVGFSGNLKDAATPLPANKQDLTKLRRTLGQRPVWCAASTHEGEDEIIINAHKTVLETSPNTLMILAPRHPDRGGDIARLLEQHGLSFARRSEGQSPTSDKQVYLFDTIGEMGLAYRLAALTCMCGSLVEGLSGHNPLEPARLGSAVITGANVASFADSYMQMCSHDAARRILSPDQVGREVADLLGHKKKLIRLQEKSEAFAKGRDGVLEYVWEQLLPIMPPRTSEL